MTFKEKLEKIHERNKAKKEQRREMHEEELACAATAAPGLLAIGNAINDRIHAAMEHYDHRADLGERLMPRAKH